ncbi:MAG: amino acid adenylation domain-containing protein [Chloroflexi bacterium]|nr:amino acid adenylation domain-containing protein [Chloroflexota bacterium]
MNKKNIADFYPLSPMQQGMLFHSLYAPESGVYVEQMSCRLQGDLDSVAFIRAWEALLQRYDILRAGFLSKGLKEPVQVVHRQVTLPVKELDWREFTAVQQEIMLENLLAAERRAGFDLTQPPLMRLALAQTGENAYRFVWTYHHILLDGWSLPVLFQELFVLYEWQRRGTEPPLPRPRPFRDYIAWLRRQDTAKAAAFWRKTLKGFNAPTPLVVNRPVTEQPEDGKYGELDLALPAETTAVLQNLARRKQLTLNTFVQGAWALLLHRYSGRDDVLFGATVSGRPPELPGSEQMVGLFINTLPVRVQINREQTTLEWLKSLQMQQIELRQYEYSPLVDVQGWSDVPRDLPLFNSILVFENYPIESAAPNGENSLSLSDIRSVEQTNFPLTVVAGAADSLHLKIAYDGRLFAEDTIRRMLGHLAALLQGMADDPTRSPADLPLLTAAEWRQISQEWNGRTADFPLHRPVHELFEAQAAETPEATAVVSENGRLTYAELNRRANQLARYLQKRGVGPESIVGISVNRSLDMVVGILGILKAGGAYLPLDPTYPAERLAFMLEDAQPALALTQAAVANTAVANLPTASLIYLDADWPEIAEEDSANLATAVSPDNLAYIIYTSGSTGQPKGTLLQHRGLVNFAEALIEAYGLGGNHWRVLQFASLSFDASIPEIFTALLSGAALYLPPPETIVDPDKLHRYLQMNRISLITMPPTMLRLLPADDLPDLQAVISAGEACTPDLARCWGYGRRFFNGYGPTEATVGPALHEVDPDSLPPQATSVPIGRPIANMQMYLLDKEQRPVPIGVPGEIYIGGVGLARGYLHRPELTAERFVQLSVIGNRLSVIGNQSPATDHRPPTTDYRLPTTVYRTGDLARRLPDGTLEFLGRVDNQVKLRGFRIELEEIEVILAQHEGVAAAVVALREDRPGEKQLAAYWIPAGDTAVDETALGDWLRQKLPAYMVPARFVALAEFPLLPNGKVDRRRLPAPDRIRGEDAGYTPPRDDLEAGIVKIWEEVLGVQPVGVTDNFFALGGHSLLAVRIMAQIQQKLNQSLQLADLFQMPTIAELAALLRRPADVPPGPALIGLQTEGEKRPLFFIHPSGGSVHWYVELAQNLDGERPFYGIQAQGIYGDAPLHTSVEEMAAAYVPLIRERQPEGPYLLGSWSMGVVVAYETARQLTAQGQAVAALIILDQGPVLPAEEPEDDAAYYVQVFGKHVPLSLERLRQMTAEEQAAHVLAEAQKAGWMMPDVTPEQFRQFVGALRTHTEAWRAYEPRPYPGPLTLFRAEIQEENDLPLDMGWGELALGGVTVLETPGDHLSMIQEPHAPALAAQLRAFLDEVYSRGIPTAQQV